MICLNNQSPPATTEGLDVSLKFEAGFEVMA
jgi:hypothetical protein